MTRLSDGAVSRLQALLGAPSVEGGRYMIFEEIGQGGMGTVYRAQDTILNREVALKALRPELSADHFADRLQAESRVLASLEHPGIVPVHDAGILTDGRHFYVMKRVHGEPLDQYVSRVSLPESLRVFLRVCDTVGFAHGRGVIHRDLKPANVMIGRNGEVMVLDWGIARTPADDSHPGTATSHSAGNTGNTAPGTVLGTPGYMAPEQAEGIPHRVDHRADIHALGVILRDLASSHAPRHDVRPLASIARKATAPDPANRYPDVAALARDIASFLDGFPVLAHRESLAERVGRVYRTYQTPILLVLAYLVMRLLFFASRQL